MHQRHDAGASLFSGHFRPSLLPIRLQSSLSLYIERDFVRRMSVGRSVTMKYLAELAGVNVNTVRRYVAVLRSLAEERDLFSAQE